MRGDAATQDARHGRQPPCGPAGLVSLRARHRRPCALSFACGRRGEYCIKELGGVNRLAGPGCPIEDQSGYAQFGMMKTRPTPTSCTVQLQSANEKLVRAGLEKKCFELLGEHDEIAIYEHYRAQRDGDGEGAALHTMLCGRECRTDEERRPKKGKKAKRRDQLRPPPPPPPPPPPLQPAAVAKSTESPVAELRRLRGGAFHAFFPRFARVIECTGLGTELRRVREAVVELHAEEAAILGQVESLLNE